MSAHIYVYMNDYFPGAISSYLHSDDIQIMPLQAPYCSNCSKVEIDSDGI